MSLFTKFLEIDEIVEHSLVMVKLEVGTVIHIYPNDGGYEVEFKNGRIETLIRESITPIKLFLCSDDLHIGDNINRSRDVYKKKGVAFFKGLPESSEAAEPYDMVVGYLNENGEDTGKENLTIKGFWLKVIGEVSKKAIWVRRQYEVYKDDDIKLMIQNGSYTTDYNNIKHIPVDEVEKWITIVSFKCPCCGRFSD